MPSKSGLYYQSLGDIFISENSWKLVVYRNLEPLFLSKDSLKRQVHNYETFVQNFKHLPSVHTTNSFIRVSLNKIETRINELSYYTNSNDNNRVKRELLDGLSTVLKWLIGTPDAKDAKYYDQCIELLEKQQLNNNNVLKQQLQIISSTISNFNETILKISYDEYKINDNFKKISSYLNETGKIIFNLQASEEISAISIQILESVMSLERELDDIIMSILFIKSGAIHPSIISTLRIYKELLATNHARINSNLVTPLTLNNMHYILESTSISSYIYLNKLVYILEFPLVRNEKFNLFHIYSIPIKHLNSSYYSTLFPEQKYLAASTTRQYYVSTSLLDECKTFAPKRRVCKNLLVYNYNSRPICEMEILHANDNQMPSNCEPATFSGYVDTFQPLGENQWIFVLRHTRTPYVAECGDNIQHGDISGSGIISLEPGCRLNTAFVTLNAEEDSTLNITHPIVTVNIEDACIPENTKLNSPEILPIVIKNIPLDSLKSIKEQINIQSQLIKDNSESFHPILKSNYSYFGLIFGILMVAFLIYKCRPWLTSRRIQRNPANPNESSSCIQIFNHCFDNSRRRQHIGIPMNTYATTNNNACISEDEDTEAENSQSPGTSKKARSLF